VQASISAIDTAGCKINQLHKSVWLMLLPACDSLIPGQIQKARERALILSRGHNADLLSLMLRPSLSSRDDDSLYYL